MRWICLSNSNCSFALLLTALGKDSKYFQNLEVALCTKDFLTFLLAFPQELLQLENPRDLFESLLQFSCPTFSNLFLESNFGAQ